jgi:hypothetical protein
VFSWRVFVHPQVVLSSRYGDGFGVKNMVMLSVLDLRSDTTELREVDSSLRHLDEDHPPC